MIRNGSPEDAAAMAAIYNHYVETSPVIFSERTLSPEEMKAKIERLIPDGKFPFLVSEENGIVTGYCYAHLWQPDPVYARSWEVTIYLAPGAGGKGTGTALLRRLVDECRTGGCHTLVSFITLGNRPCERIHQKTGFTLAGIVRQAGYKFGEYHSDAIYQLIL